nr:acyl-CoA dehydrogenase family protein [Acinetobacter sp. Marseille-Q1620]
MNDININNFLTLNHVRHILSEQEAIQVAEEVAEQLRQYAENPSYNSSVPYEQARLISEAGLTAISVPKQFGGLGASVLTIVNVVKIISSADAGVGQLLQIHFTMLRSLLVGFPDEVRDQVVQDILNGKRLGNALAEVGGKNKLDHKTRIEKNQQGEYVLNGSKFYSTGSFLAEWISLFAGSDDGTVNILLHRDSEGLELVDDWEAIGQNNSVSGTVNFHNVIVDEKYIVKRGLVPPIRTGLTWPQILHAAMDTGIAKGALENAVHYLQHHARPWVESGVEKAVYEQHVIKQVGEFAVLVRSSEALLERSAAIFEEHFANVEDEALQTELILSVAATRSQSDYASLKISSEIFGLLGASSTLSKWNLDRFWRNARTHTTHDPIRWRLYHIGNYYLNDVPPGEYNTELIKKQVQNSSVLQSS